jgi:hypothetical protein
MKQDDYLIYLLRTNGTEHVKIACRNGRLCPCGCSDRGHEFATPQEAAEALRLEHRNVRVVEEKEMILR